jgi:hypothetical protein
LDDCSAQVFPYNIFAYCSICSVDCKFARHKKNNWRVATDFGNEVRMCERHAVNCIDMSVKDVQGKGDEDTVKEKSTGTRRC